MCEWPLWKRSWKRNNFGWDLCRWCFDVELVFLSKWFGIPMVEISVNWSEIPGSKVNLLSIPNMLWELALMSVGYRTRMWKIHSWAFLLSTDLRSSTKPLEQVVAKAVENLIEPFWRYTPQEDASELEKMLVYFDLFRYIRSNRLTLMVQVRQNDWGRWLCFQIIYPFAGNWNIYHLREWILTVLRDRMDVSFGKSLLISRMDTTFLFCTCFRLIQCLECWQKPQGQDLYDASRKSRICTIAIMSSWGRSGITCPHHSSARSSPRNSLKGRVWTWLQYL